MSSLRLTRRAALVTGLATAALPPLAQAQTPGRVARQITVYKTPWCGCCGGWVAHMRGAGWTALVAHFICAPNGIRNR